MFHYQFAMPKGDSDLLQFLSKLFGRVNVPLVATAGIFATLVQFSRMPEWWPKEWSGFLPWVKLNQFWLLPVPPLAAFFLLWAKQKIETRATRLEREVRLKALLCLLLRRLRSPFVAKTFRDDPETDHRLTIFLADADESKLQIVARSSEATAGSRTSWSIDPDVPSKCEGIAGLAWYHNAQILVPGKNEPELPDVSRACSDAEIDDYARRTFVTPEQVRERKWPARSFAALVLRSGGKRLGVLVLDSVSPSGANLTIIRRNEFTADMLVDIISGWRKP
ncbi:MAG: hypothetical protein IID33_02540 [Planctomycetes bacterium]|nr:hypothetical protein [Planctomycetota bacterium]